MANPLTMKLEHGAELTDSDRTKLDLIISCTRRLGAREDVIHEGERPENVHLVLDGFACRYKMLADGRRQIMAFMIPGDFCDLHVAILGEMDHGIATLTPCVLVDIPRTTIDEMTAHEPRITRALWWSTLVDEAILREWLVNMGQRPADRKMAHMMCELLVRLQTVGEADENSYTLSLNQSELGDTLGLSIVHVNRTLQSLRGEGLITFRGKKLTICDVARLNAYAGFNPNYLHLTHRREEAGAKGD